MENPKDKNKPDCFGIRDGWLDPIPDKSKFEDGIVPANVYWQEGYDDWID
jgi:hypothetical protein